MVNEYYLHILDRLRISRGDVVLLSSDMFQFTVGELKRTKKMPNMNDLLDTFIDRLGEEGTLLLPTYNWFFCHGETYDYRNTLGQTGSLGNVALKRDDFKRTQHPIYSFAVWGRDQSLLCQLQNKSAFGGDSPFAYFELVHAKNVFIGIPMIKGYTFVHYVEQKSNAVKYRYDKLFRADYIDEYGIQSNRVYSMYVRKLNMNVENKQDESLQKDFLKSGRSTHFMEYNILYSSVDMFATIPVIQKEILKNKSYRISKYKGQ